MPTETPAPDAPDATSIVWTCPYCGSDDLRVLYDERRACRVTTLNDTGDPRRRRAMAVLRRRRVRRHRPRLVRLSLRRLQHPQHHAT